MVTFCGMKLKDLVKQALRKKGMNQSDLANRIKVTPAQVSRIISGERGTTIDTLVQIADALGIRRDEILRTAAGLPAPDEKGDPWVDEMNYKIKMIPPALRPIVEKSLDAFIAEPEPALKTRKAKA